MKAENLELLDLMFDNKRQYQIPVYQRNYDWKKDNCLELFNDIISAYINEKSHFLGTVVQVQQDEENGIKKYIIIDGQQRYTSIYLLLKALYDLSDGDDKETLKDLLFNKASRDFSNDEKTKLKLKPIKSDNEQFMKLMYDKFDEMDHTSNIYINYEYFKTLINGKLNEGISIRNIKNGISRLVIVMISLKEPNDDPQLIFERINSTGEDLTLADKIRNFLLMTDENMDELFEEYWLPIENLIGREKMESFFQTYLVYKIPELVKEKESYQRFKKFADDNSITHKEYLQELKKFSKYYNAFIRESSSYSKYVNRLLSAFRLLGQSTIYPFLLNVFDDFENGILTEDVLLEILKLYINYTIRRLITGVPSNSLRGLYKNLYKRIFTSNEKKNNYLDSIYEFMSSQLVGKDTMPLNTSFKEGLINEPIYKNGKLCKYLLSIIENGFYSKEEVTIDDTKTIEHIMPQNNQSEDWKNEIGNSYEFVYGKYLHTLGNLTLTGFNSELSDKSFLEKKNEYKKSKFILLNEDVINQEHWRENEIRNRALRLSNIIIKLLELPSLFEQKLDVASSNRHTVNDGCDYTGKKITSFMFMGEVKNVSTAKELLTKFCESIYILKTDDFKEMAKSNYKFANAECPFITYDSSLLRTPKEIGNSGIFIETNCSTNAIIIVIRKLIDLFDLSFDDFVFYTE